MSSKKKKVEKVKLYTLIVHNPGFQDLNVVRNLTKADVYRYLKEEGYIDDNDEFTDLGDFMLLEEPYKECLAFHKKVMKEVNEFVIEDTE